MEIYIYIYSIYIFDCSVFHPNSTVVQILLTGTKRASPGPHCTKVYTGSIWAGAKFVPIQCGSMQNLLRYSLDMCKICTDTVWFHAMFPLNY